jgi:hypothetical protein
MHPLDLPIVALCGAFLAWLWWAAGDGQIDP